MIIKTTRVAHLVLLVAGLSCGAATMLVAPVQAAQPAGGERILSFHSDITVHRDATMTVQETIRVNVQGQRIQRGIYRDFPTVSWASLNSTTSCIGTSLATVGISR